MRLSHYIQGMYKKFNMPRQGDIVGFSKKAIRECPDLAGIYYQCQGSHWGSPTYHLVHVGDDEEIIYNEYWRLIQRA